MSDSNGADKDPGYTVEIIPPRSKRTPPPNSNGGGAASVAYVPEPWPKLEPAALYGLAGEVTVALKPITESDPVALLLQFLTCFGNAIGRASYYEVESTRHYGNLFIVLAGNTSKARKGTSFERIRNLFRPCIPTWERERIQGGMSSGEGIISAVRDPVWGMRKGVEEMVDPGVTDKRLLLVEHEFYQALAVLHREGNTLSRVIRDAWDCREELGTQTKQRMQATEACISIIAHITIEELQRCLDETSMANGFANRFLFACVKRAAILPFGGQLSERESQRLGEQISETLAAAQNATPIKFSTPASERWEAEYEELSRGSNGLLAHIASRGEAQVVRLSLLYALLDRSPEIDLVHLEAALAVWRFCAASARYIFGDKTGDPAADVIMQALRAKAPGGLMKRDLFALFYGRATAASINGVLARLQATGKAINRTEQPTAGGRPREMWYAL
jgi:hypothetical protein